MTGHVTAEWRMSSFPLGPRSTGGGNPAGVVLDPPALSSDEMTRIAVRLNPLSETAFVGPREDGAYRLRYFAPGGEVDLCGHATAAAYAVLARTGRLGPLPAEVRSVAPGGTVGGRVERGVGEVGTGEAGRGAGDAADAVVVWMDMPVARRVETPLDLDEVAGALGLPREVLQSRPAAAIEDLGIRVALLPLPELEALDSIRPDFDRLRRLGRPGQIIVFYPFVLDAVGLRVRARAFAPAVDIDEDPATGTAAAALGAYLARERLIGPHTELRIRQGEAMGRPSELRLGVQHEEGDPLHVRVGGWVTGQPVAV